MDLDAIQSSLQKHNMDGYLFYDFHGRDILAYRILGIDNPHYTRRWFYFIPAKGTPHKVVSPVEPYVLDMIPGEKHIVLKWEDLHATLKSILSGHYKIAMHYSPMGDVPYVSIIDGGTLDLIRSFGVEVVSAQDLIQEFEGLVTEKMFESYKQAGPIMHQITQDGFDEIGRRIQANETVTEYDIHKFIQKKYRENGLITDMSPIVGVNEHAADPHYVPLKKSSTIKNGDLLLIDSWAKLKGDDSVYVDITRMAFVGEDIPPRIQEIWDVVKEARDIAIKFETEKLESGESCAGWEVDQIARNFVEDQGFGKFFSHRLGHSIGRETHGNAVNLDSLETKDTRSLGPLVLHSIEPGIYIPEEKIGIRSEVNVYITSERKVIVTGPKQEEIYKIKIQS
ncbi:MAG: aminopeptidase P family protein [Promethearchaeota archaeon]|nr:MAG: aminopeptidase P family protein [Candidatus Lokiarchaeota archaeon]